MKRIIAIIMSLLISVPTIGYTANISSTQTNDTVYIHVNAYHSEDEIYNCCEIELTYDTEMLRFNNELSSLGCGAYRDKDGQLMLIDFGADKPLGESIYTLAFDIVGCGYTDVKLDRAAFSTAEKAVSEDVEPITNTPNSIFIWLDDE